MARIRSIHPGLFTDEEFMALTVEAPLAAILYVGLLTEADDHGVFEWKPLTTKARLLPAAICDVAQLVDVLVQHQFVRRYDHAGRKYGAVRNFCRYQRPRKPQYLHPITDELRTYVALSDVGTDQDQVEDASGTPNPPDKSKRVAQESAPSSTQETALPHKSGKPPQMEDGGWREGETEASLRSASSGAAGGNAPEMARDRGGFCRSELDDIEAKCRSSLGKSAPTDPVIGPMALLIGDGIPIGKITTILASEARRPRKSPIRTWGVWATIVRDEIAKAGPPPALPTASDPNDPVVDFRTGMQAPHSTIRTQFLRDKWLDGWRGKPGRPDCVLPQEFQAELLAERQRMEAA